MSVISTELYSLGNVVKAEYNADMAYCRTVVTLNGPAATLAVGTVLGKVTADGKYKVAIQTAGDGSAVADAIVLRAITVLNATDTKVLCLTRGPSSISKTALVLDATYDLDAEKAVVYASLEAKGIQVLDTI